MDLTNGSRRDAPRELARVLCEPSLLERTPDDLTGPLARRAEQHGVAALLWSRARKAGVTLGPAWRCLRERAAAQTAAATLRDAEALEVLARVHDAGVPFVVLKGLALAYTIYAHPSERDRSDTDLLVREADLPRLEHVFLQMGYTVLSHVRGELTLPQRHYYRHDSRGFRHAWDVHWRVTASQALRDAVSEEALVAHARPLSALGGAHVPSRPDALLLACVHRLAHHFDDARLIWLWDIRLLLEVMTQEEVALFARVASRPQSAAACARSLDVARERAGAPIPDALRSLLVQQPHATAAFLWSGSRRRITYLVGEIRAAPPRDRVRLLREHLLPSWSSMRERYPAVPRFALPFAYAWRLLAGIPKWLLASR